MLAIYVEATADETELRILKQFRKHIPRLPESMSLPDACAALWRSGAGRDRKVLVVIDQFEQWLRTHTDFSATALVSALRQCDGGRLQIILLVRDDFFASVNRLFRELEDPLVEGRNYALVDRFDRQHACKVLTAFGRAYGKLDNELSTSQEQFSPARAAQFNELRGEVMLSLAKARADGDFESRLQLITLRDQLSAQAAKEGLRLDSGFRFVLA